jgi:hypothetical protein
VKYKPAIKLLFVIAFLVLLLLPAACVSEEDPAEVPIIDEPVETVEPAVEEMPTEESMQAANYYWPWISHGQVELSSGEIIIGPDLFESELGFIGEFTPGDSYEGLLVWRVEDTDVFMLEWISLVFDVEYFEQSEWKSSSIFEFKIDSLQPEPGDDGIQEIEVNITDLYDSFEVTIRSIELGKESEGNFSTDPISYIAFDISMRVIENP